jgi:hypothetical protein
METSMWKFWGDPAPISLDGAIPFIEPPVREGVSASEQVATIISELQEEGLVGLVERTEILRRYPEHCWMHGWIPVSENHLFEALAKVVARKRPFDKGQRITCYVIPAAGHLPAAQEAHKAKLEAIVNAKPLRHHRMRRAA